MKFSLDGRGTCQGFILEAVIVILVLVVLAVLGVGYYYFYKQRENSSVVVIRPRTELNQSLIDAMEKNKVKVGAPVFLRILKEPKELELWMKPEDSRQYKMVKVYTVLSQSGEIGPKTKEGDWQAPEGFYRTFAFHLNPNSKYHLSFNIGYPNLYDKGQQRTGSFIMVHGGAQSRGCFAMGDPAIEELYELVEQYLQTAEGKKAGVPVQIYPFVPTPERMMKERASEHYAFWSFLKKAWDYTEQHRVPAPVKFAPGSGKMSLERGEY